jgi:hypothetical protein
VKVAYALTAEDERRCPIPAAVESGRDVPLAVVIRHPRLLDALIFKVFMTGVFQQAWIAATSRGVEVRPSGLVVTRQPQPHGLSGIETVGPTR